MVFTAIINKTPAVRHNDIFVIDWSNPIAIVIVTISEYLLSPAVPLFINNCYPQHYHYLSVIVLVDCTYCHILKGLVSLPSLIGLTATTDRTNTMID